MALDRDGREGQHAEGAKIPVTGSQMTRQTDFDLQRLREMKI